MTIGFQQISREFRKDYFKALLLIALVPLFPEYLSFFLIIGALTFAIRDMKQSGRKLRFTAADMLIAAYCLYMSVTCFYSTHPFQSALTAVMWWFMLMAYLTISNLVTDHRRMHNFLFCISTVAGMVGLIALIQNQLNVHFNVPIRSFWDWLDTVVFRFVPFDLTLVPFPTRAYSTFPNPNMLAQYLVMAAPFAIGYNFMENTSGMRLYNRLCLVFTALGVMASYSRGGYVALIALALALVVVNLRKHFGTVVLCSSVSALFIPEAVISRLTTVSDSGRFRIWAEALRRIAERPLFGYGAGTQPTAVIFDSIGMDAPHAHNIVLQVLMEGGLIALALLIAIAILLLKNGLRLMLRRNPPSFWAGFAACGFVLATFLHGLVDYPLTTPKLICTFLCLLATAQRFAPCMQTVPAAQPAQVRCYAAYPHLSYR